MRTIARLLAISLLLAAALTSCSSPRGAARAPAIDPSTASSLADSLQAELAGRFEPPARTQYGAFADPATGDSIAGFVVRVSAPYEMIDDDTIPHEWLRTSFAARGWVVDAEADGPDGASYRVLSGRRVVTVEATWEDLHEPAEVADWYSLSLGIASARPSPTPSPR